MKSLAVLIFIFALVSVVICAEEHCLQPFGADGDGLRSCLAFMHRWGYNPETEKCEIFTYGGCGGNDNKFLTQEECEKSCL